VPIIDRSKKPDHEEMEKETEKIKQIDSDEDQTDLL
jgi:hypothetical protein